MDLFQHPDCKRFQGYVHDIVHRAALAPKQMGLIPYCTYASPQASQSGTDFAGGVYLELQHPERARLITLSLMINTDGDFEVNWHLDDPDSLEEFTSLINNALRIANNVENVERGICFPLKVSIKDSRGFHLACRVKLALEKSGILDEHEALDWLIGGTMTVCDFPVGTMRLTVHNEEHGDGMIIFLHSQAGGRHIMFVNDWMYAPEFEAVRVSMQKRFDQAWKDHKEEIEAI